MRGKGQLAVKGEADAGITPAYAGKRFSACSAEKPDRDHPRLCGEKLLAELQQQCL